MKTSIFLFTCLFLLSSCAKEEVEDLSVHELTILLNGAPWAHDSFHLSHRPDSKQVRAFWDIISGDSSIYLITSRVDNSIYEKQVYYRVPIRPGNYYLIDKQPSIKNDTIVKVTYSSTISLDVAYRYYKILETESNHITIDAYDRDRQIISGKLNVTFINANNDKDTLRFTEGVFRTTIENEPE